MLALVSAVCMYAQSSGKVVFPSVGSGLPEDSINYDITDGVMTLTAGHEGGSAYSLPAPRDFDKFDYPWNNDDRARFSVKTIVFDLPIEFIDSCVFVGFNNVESLKFSEKVTSITRGIDSKSFVLKGSDASVTTEQRPTSKLQSIYFYGITSVPSLSANDSLKYPFWCQDGKVVKVFVPDYTNPASGLRLIDAFKLSNEYWGSEYANIYTLPGVPVSEGMMPDGKAEVTWNVVESAKAYHLTLIDESYTTVLDTMVLVSELKTKPLSIARRRIVMSDQLLITIVIPTDFDTEGEPTAVKAEVSGMDTEKSYRLKVESLDIDDNILTSSIIDFGIMPEKPTNITTFTNSTPVRKFIHNGQVVILHGDKLYGLHGEVVNL